MQVRVYETAHELESAAAALIDEVLAAFAGPVTFGLAGGSTPTATYRMLRESDLDWTRVTAWLGDERWVPDDHPDSNTRMARETLLDHVPAHLLAPDHDLGAGAEIAARRYEQALDHAFVVREGVRAPDLVVLGMGDDGHTASLFPHTAALEVTDRHYVANWIPSLDAWRLTATLPLLWSARKIVFMVNGEHKAHVLARIIEDEAPYPAQIVASGARDVVWLLDGAAASSLSRSPA